MAVEPTTLLNDPETGARVTYHPGYLAPATADELFRWLSENTPWQREAPVVFGKSHEVKRRTFAYGAPGARYRYSGVERNAVAWPPILLPIAERLERELGAPFNFGLCNQYPDGEASIGKHSDAEADLVRDHPIAGLSLGATRDFMLYDRSNERVGQVALEHGSLVVMWGATQRWFKHAVPKRRRVTEPRINITFRVMKARAA
jgi:alkylated DNA repair dioxygenase AlkB